MSERLKALVPVFSVAVVVAICASSMAFGSMTRHVKASRPVCAPRLGLRPANDNPQSASVLVPMAPREVLLCRYYGLNQPPGNPARAPRKLAAERLLRRVAPSRSLAREFDALQPFPEGPIYCPADDGSALYALFIYASQQAVPVEAHLSGCPSASNGRAGLFWASPRLEERLKALTSQ
jgi:hypothetical protein